LGFANGAETATFPDAPDVSSCSSIQSPVASGHDRLRSPSHEALTASGASGEAVV